MDKDNLVHTQMEFESELDKLQHDPDHYMTPGARAAFEEYRKNAIMAFVVLFVAVVVGVWAITERIDTNIRRDINAVAQQNCINSIPTLKKYNDFVETQIQANRDARQLALETGALDRANLNTRNIIRLQENKLPVPTIKQCQATVILQP